MSQVYVDLVVAYDDFLLQKTLSAISQCMATLIVEVLFKTVVDSYCAVTN